LYKLIKENVIMAGNAPLHTKTEDHVCHITLANPASRNALSIAMIEAIGGALEQADRDKNVRAIVIREEGPVFSAGHDLKEMTAARNHPDRGRAFFDRTMRACSAMMQQIVTHRVPVIAAVHGTATAAGCQLVASCDLAVASEDAKFITPGVNLGLFCSTPMVALSRNVSNKHAMEMLLTGEAASARHAEKIGLVNCAVPADEVEPRVKSFTDLIIAKSAAIVKTGKQAFYRQAEMPLQEAYEYCAQVMVENMLQRDAEEGINAFLEKREPHWQHE
jgi:enoyl-CoA hydratase/carnithine racemase